jgi:hypothetical protein
MGDLIVSPPAFFPDKSTFDPNDYDHFVRFDSKLTGSECMAGNPIELYWSIFATHIEIMAINVAHDGFVSVGWCEQGSYTPARNQVAPRCTYISGAVRPSSGQVACFDQFDKLPTASINTGQHSTVTVRRDNLYGGADNNLDCAGAIVGASLKFKWTRLLNTGEANTFSAFQVTHLMDTNIVNQKQWTIWAVGPTGGDCITPFSAMMSTGTSGDCTGNVHPGCGWEQFNWFSDYPTTPPSPLSSATSATRAPTPNPTPRPTPPPAQTPSPVPPTALPTPAPTPLPAPSPPPSLSVWLDAVAHWTFDSDFKDEIASTLLTPHNGAGLSTALYAVGGGSLSLNTVNDAVALRSAQQAVVALTGTRFNLTDSGNQLSHSLWFHCNPARCNGILVWTQNGYLRTFDLANGNSTLRFALYASVTHEQNSGEVLVRDDAFHHLVAVFDGATMKMFLDCTSLTCSPVIVDSFGPVVLNGATISGAGACGVLFGARCQADNTTTSGTNAFRGEIDDYMMFNKALTIGDILQIRSRKSTSAPTPATATRTSTSTTATKATTSATTKVPTPNTPAPTPGDGATVAPTPVATPIPTPPPTPAPTPVPLNAPCDAYTVACSQCVDSTMHPASTCRFCDNECLDTSETGQPCSLDAFYNVAPGDTTACPRTAPPIRAAWREVAVGGNETDYRLRWRHDGTNIEFELSAKTIGWVGVGWSRAQFIEGASHLTMDAYIGSMTDAGLARVINAYSMFNIVQPATNSKPLLLGLPTVSATGGRTTVSFVRPIAVPIDAAQNVAIEDRDMYVSWAVGSDDIVRTPGSEQCLANSVAVADTFCYKEHTAQGVLRINFLNPSAVVATTDVVETTTSLLESSACATAMPVLLFLTCLDVCFLH